MMVRVVEIVAVAGVGLLLVLGGLVVMAVVFDRRMAVRQQERERRAEVLRLRRDRRIRELAQAGLLDHGEAVANGDAKLVVLRRRPPEDGAA
jgi:hypothetical protein